MVEPVLGAVVLCRRCRRDILPKLKQSSLHRDVHRAAAAGMIVEPDARAEKIRARKERKGVTRATVRAVGITGAAKIFLETKHAVRQDAPSDECPSCQQMIRARFKGYDPATNTAYAEIIDD